MSSPLDRPAVHYGIGVISALLIGTIGYLFTDGTVQLVFFAVAAFELVVTPQIMKKVFAQASAN